METETDNTAVYYEDDWRALVEIQEDISDDVFEAYRLRVIRTLLKSKIYNPTPDGEVFEVCWKHNYTKGWHLFRKGHLQYKRWVSGCQDEQKTQNKEL